MSSFADTSSPSAVKVEKDPPAPEKRLLTRLGRQLILHVHPVSLLCYTAGVVAVLLLPLLAKNTYISENALMPGSGSPTFGNSDILAARASAAKLQTLASQEQGAQRKVSSWLVKQMIDIGADCCLHPFFPPRAASLANHLTTLQHFKWSTSNLSQTDHLERQTGLGVNVVGIIKALQGEGNEAIVLVTPFDSQNFAQEDSLSLGIGLALFARLSKALWIARDIIWLVADAKYGAYTAVDEWLREYHELSSSGFSSRAKNKSDLVEEFLLDEQASGEQSFFSLSDFKRSGTIATGLVFELKIIPGEVGDHMNYRAEGPNGQMPNLDFINVINSVAVWRESLGFRLESLPSLTDLAPLKYVGNVLMRVDTLARQMNPTWKFASDAVAYSKNMGTLLSSIFFQVIGLPTGAHGAFRDYQIDAVSVQFPVPPDVSDFVLSKSGRLLEGVLRSVNNLLEKWHQSFFLYLQPAPHRYISVGVYMQPFALLLTGLPLTAVALCFPPKEEEMKTQDLKKGSSEEETNIKKGLSAIKEDTGRDNNNSEGRSEVKDSQKWLQAVLLVGGMQIWAFFVTLILALISRTNFMPEVKLSVWFVLSAGSLMMVLGGHDFFSANLSILNSPSTNERTQLWEAVKALTLGVASIGLGVMSLVNYAVALVGALILVPICLGAFPLKYSWNYATRPGSGILTTFGLAIGVLMTILGSPPGLAFLVWSLSGQFWTPSLANFWYLMESLLTWQSGLSPYLLVIHLPCSMLCLYILYLTHQFNSIKQQ